MADKLLSSIIRNAIVPTNAPILPFQSFVNGMAIFVDQIDETDALNLSSLGITYIETNLFLRGIRDMLVAIVGTINLNVSSNAITNTDDILGLLQSDAALNPGNFLDISGGTNANPTNGAANADAWALATNASYNWIVKFNVHSRACSLNYTTLTADFSGNSMSAVEINALLAFLVSESVVDIGLGWTLNLTGGTNAAPTAQGITDAQTLRDNSWTITTN